MTEVAYFENVTTKKRYKILDLDKETETVRLQGPNRAFNVAYDKDHFKRMGYRLIMVEEKSEIDEENE